MKTSKVCTDCKKELLLTKFPVYKKRAKDYIRNQCSECHDIRVRTNWFKSNYGLTIDEYHTILKEQNNKCGICGLTIYSKPESPKPVLTACVDHCHGTSIIRGLLCRSCNMGLGSLGDDVVSIKKALAYVSETVDIRHRNNGVKKPQRGSYMDGWSEEPTDRRTSSFLTTIQSVFKKLLRKLRHYYRA